MKFYHDLVTQKSWEQLQQLNKTVKMVLIGGWAAYLYTRTLKSKDIDIVVDYNQLPILSNNYQLTKNERLKKYEARKEEVQIDIYLPYYSEVGIPVEELIKKTQEVEGFVLVEPNYLFVMKIHVLAQRARSPKGRKDFIDLIALVDSGRADLKGIKNIIHQYSLERDLEVFKLHLAENYEVPELSLNKHQFARLKKRTLAQLSV